MVAPVTPWRARNTIVQESIWYHVCFNNESNNEIIKMNWTRLQKSVEFENYIIFWCSSCSSCSSLELLEHLESLRLTFLIRQCSSLSFAGYLEHSLGPEPQLRCLSEVPSTWVVTTSLRGILWQHLLQEHSFWRSYSQFASYFSLAHLIKPEPWGASHPRNLLAWDRRVSKMERKELVSQFGMLFYPSRVNLII